MARSSGHIRHSQSIDWHTSKDLLGLLLFDGCDNVIEFFEGAFQIARLEAHLRDGPSKWRYILDQLLSNSPLQVFFFETFSLFGYEICACNYLRVSPLSAVYLFPHDSQQFTKAHDLLSDFFNLLV